MSVAYCKTCKEPIMWIKHKGRKHPVNATPKKLFVFKNGSHNDGDNYQITFEQAGCWTMDDCFESHFATCPDAEKHRKGK